MVEKHDIGLEPEFYKISIDPSLPEGTYAEYYRNNAPPPVLELKNITFNHGMFHIRINPSILTSDEAIIGVLTHERSETQALEVCFDDEKTMTKYRFHSLTNERSGTLHLKAWEDGDKAVIDYRNNKSELGAS